ncbi:MAG: hypothetical protein KTR18_05130 [Acidiferrobacterales bacterium]|nr:hypothetical protein [Acidiferrobacterales bacterium]
MIDVNRRKTLKTLTTGAAALTGASVGMLSSDLFAGGHKDVQLEVHFSANGAQDRLVMHNPGAKDLEVAMQFSGDISVPGGQLDVSKLMQNGSVPIKAGETRYFKLPRATRDETASVSASTHGHQALRFPVSDNVYVDHISVISDRMKPSTRVPLLMRKLV